MMVRIGLPLVGGALPAGARILGAPVLVSANALARYRRVAEPGSRSLLSRGGWRDFAGFRRAPDLDGMDVALDSAGFVAWAHYGGFPWRIEDYVQLAASRRWTWWAQMDACCEEEIAPRRGTVRLRQAETIRLLAECRAGARRAGMSMPMPVLQGRTPADYVWHASQIDLGDAQIVGVGSVCRRSAGGPEGVLAVVDALDRVLPAQVRLHLFGVKSDAMSQVAANPRVASVDSMAWDMAARAEVRTGRTMAVRVAAMGRWYAAQIAAVGRAPGMQAGLFGPGGPTGIDNAHEEWGDLLAGGECGFGDAAFFSAWDACWGRDAGVR